MCIYVDIDHEVEGEDVRDSGAFSAPDVSTVSFTQRKRKPSERQATWKYKSQMELFFLQPNRTITSNQVKLADGSLSVVPLERLYDELGYSYSWQAEEPPKLTKGKKTVVCCTENVVSFVSVTKQSTAPSLERIPSEHFPARKTVCPKKKWKETVKKCLNRSHRE